MLRNVASCRIMSSLCHVISRHVTSCHVMPHDVLHVTSWHVMSRHVISRTFRDSTLVFPEGDRGVALVFDHGFVKTVSADFEWLRWRLFLFAQFSTFSSSSTFAAAGLDSTMRYVSAGNFEILFSVWTVFRSDASTIYAAGPRLDPFIILAVISSSMDIASLNWVQWDLPSK